MKLLVTDNSPLWKKWGIEEHDGEREIFFFDSNIGTALENALLYIGIKNGKFLFAGSVGKKRVVKYTVNPQDLCHFVDLFFWDYFFSPDSPL